MKIKYYHRAESSIESWICVWKVEAQLHAVHEYASRFHIPIALPRIKSLCETLSRRLLGFYSRLGLSGKRVSVGAANQTAIITSSSLLTIPSELTQLSELLHSLIRTLFEVLFFKLTNWSQVIPNRSHYAGFGYHIFKISKFISGPLVLHQDQGWMASSGPAHLNTGTKFKINFRNRTTPRSPYQNISVTEANNNLYSRVSSNTYYFRKRAATE